MFAALGAIGARRPPHSAEQRPAAKNALAARALVRINLGRALTICFEDIATCTPYIRKVDYEGTWRMSQIYEYTA
jgi:hypothetical protein